MRRRRLDRVNTVRIAVPPFAQAPILRATGTCVARLLGGLLLRAYKWRDLFRTWLKSSGVLDSTRERLSSRPMTFR